MRQKFKSRQDLSCYINRYVNRNTDITNECQICGKKGHLVNYMEHPYQLRVLCNDCIRTQNIEEVPLIDVLKRRVTPVSIIEDEILTNEDIENFREQLKNPKTKYKFYKDHNITQARCMKKISLIDNLEFTSDDVLKSFEYARINRLRAHSNLNREILNNNRITELRIDKNISANYICEYCNLLPANLSKIVLGKSNPRNITKLKFAELFNVSVAEVFPEDFIFDDIYNEEDLKNHIKIFSSNLDKLRKNAKYLESNLLHIDSGTYNHLLVGDNINLYTTQRILKIAEYYKISPKELFSILLK